MFLITDANFREFYFSIQEFQFLGLVEYSNSTDLNACSRDDATAANTNGTSSSDIPGQRIEQTSKHILSSYLSSDQPGTGACCGSVGPISPHPTQLLSTDSSAIDPTHWWMASSCLLHCRPYSNSQIFDRREAWFSRSRFFLQYRFSPVSLTSLFLIQRRLNNEKMGTVNLHICVET